MMDTQKKYTVEGVVNELKQLLHEDIPEGYRRWAEDGIVFMRKYSEADVQDFPNNIFAYIGDTPMPERIRELVEGILEQGISEGSGRAACNLGALYYTGAIGEQSYAKAREYYEIAAESDDEQAVENLGECWYLGRDCEQDYQKAFECYAKGAFNGRVGSLFRIADMYRYGQYVTKNETEAYRIISRCIDLINADHDKYVFYEPDVYVRYGEMLLTGSGTEKDPLRALYWAQQAEYGFRHQEADHMYEARLGTERAMRLIHACRQVLDRENGISPAN